MRKKLWQTTTNLDDRVKSKHRPRVLAVRGQGHSAIRRDAEVLTRGHVTKPYLLFPTDDVTCSRSSEPRFHHPHHHHHRHHRKMHLNLIEGKTNEIIILMQCCVMKCICNDLFNDWVSTLALSLHQRGGCHPWSFSQVIYCLGFCKVMLSFYLAHIQTYCSFISRIAIRRSSITYKHKISK